MIAKSANANKNYQQGLKSLTLSFENLGGVENFLTSCDRGGGELRSLIAKSDVVCEHP